MVDLPWHQVAAMDPSREYVALASYLPLRRRRTVFRFMHYARAIQRQLEGTDGLIGYTLRAKPFRGRFWTLSAWRDEAALAAFVRASPHRDIMGKLQSGMGETKFIRWRVTGTPGPLSWSEGIRRLEQPDE